MKVFIIKGNYEKTSTSILNHTWRNRHFIVTTIEGLRLSIGHYSKFTGELHTTRTKVDYHILCYPRTARRKLGLRVMCGRDWKDEITQCVFQPIPFMPKRFVLVVGPDRHLKSMYRKAYHVAVKEALKVFSFPI